MVRIMTRINMKSSMRTLNMNMIPHIIIWMNIWIQMGKNTRINTMDNMYLIKSIASTLLSS